MTGSMPSMRSSTTSRASARAWPVDNQGTPMADRLLDRQTKLLEYLTSGGAIFGDGASEPLDPALQGIDRGLLRLEAQFSRDKRMEKVAAVFPRTFALLGDARPAIVR